MTAAITYRDIASIALNELHVCVETLFQIEALLLAMANQSLTPDTLEQLVKLGLGVTGDIANLESGNLEKLRADFAALKDAPQNAQSENVARESEVKS